MVDSLEIPGQFPQARIKLEERADNPKGLFDELVELDPVAAERIDPANTRRLLRALEVTIGSGRPFSSYGPGLTEYPQVPFQLLGLQMDRELLDRRINARYDLQMELGFLREVEELLAVANPIGRTARQALGYRELLAHLEDGVPLDEALEDAKLRTRRFARRQIKWYRRDPRIRWTPADETPKSRAHALDVALSMVSQSRIPR